MWIIHLEKPQKHIWKVEGSPKSVADPGFPIKEATNTGGANVLFEKVFAKNRMKMKEFDQGCTPSAP